MTLEDLKNELFGKSFPSEVKISDDQIVIDVERFLRVQFDICDRWKKHISKCPSYIRLLKFHEATKSLPE